MLKFYDIQEFLTFIENQKRVTSKTDLNEMKAYCEILGNPEKHFKSIHVTGTNGKGSVVSYLKEMFLIHGLKVATFTSPYVYQFNERITYNNEYISDDDLLKYGNYLLSKYPLFYEKTHSYPSFFEFITLLAFLYFQNLDLDIAIMEVGIGGLLDSTNVLNPLCSVISNINYDHMNILGDSLSSILNQKLGIVKKATPAVLGLKDDALILQAKNYCANLASPIYLPLLQAYEIKKCDLLCTQFILEDLGLIELSMLGFHQIENALVAITAFEISYPLLTNQRYDQTLIKKALFKTKWLGRLEVVSKDPLIILDGAHNIDGIQRVVEFIDNLKITKKRCIFSCSSNKEKFKMLDLLKNHFDEIIITEFTYKRHTEASLLFDYLDHPHKLMLDINKSIDYCLKHPCELNIFLGSLYFISEIRPKLIK